MIANWARPRLELLAAGNIRTVVSLQLFGMTFDFLRGTLLTLVMLVPTLWFTDWANSHWNLNADITKAVVITSVAAVCAAAIWKDFHAIVGTRRLSSPRWPLARGSDVAWLNNSAPAWSRPHRLPSQTAAFVAAGSTAAPVPAVAPLDRATHARMFLRCLAVQGSWNYELLLGNGIGFCVEPALRRLPGGIGGEPYNQALARQCTYFNAHPYLASRAIGSLARVEIDMTPPERIERFRKALCGPLGSVGDRLVWAAWLPACSLVALLFFGLGANPLAVVVGFLLLYNIGHLLLRNWGSALAGNMACAWLRPWEPRCCSMDRATLGGRPL